MALRFPVDLDLGSATFFGDHKEMGRVDVTRFSLNSSQRQILFALAMVIGLAELYLTPKPDSDEGVVVASTP